MPALPDVRRLGKRAHPHCRSLRRSGNSEIGEQGRNPEQSRQDHGAEIAATPEFSRETCHTRGLLLLKAQWNDPTYVEVYLNLVALWDHEDNTTLLLKRVDRGTKVRRSLLETMGCAYFLAPDSVDVIKTFLSLIKKMNLAIQEITLEGHTARGDQVRETFTKTMLKAKLARLQIAHKSKYSGDQIADMPNDRRSSSSETDR
mmetsp:Transcript_31605/g.58245  ORF Transcript_31605/g.58245 Transcript_31605/m.58245 type:complete len:202 (-) Transcript_31605:201-806(-)|eukprot:CAMPEP_0197453620 /NCGR_PEP_ID=MMETSP1175-20131217/35453_1 /TAXON_ID=1003142 /ORGANISM="Triceratium dubium, Strain CCMP147" /LENGTH=201 /DNA_ID=CAMNT_0042986967 /DNA_START=218 /DNA_END=823 /DNA_ORIENTATION=+